MNSTQQTAVEKLWTVEAGVSIPQFVEAVEAQLVRCAETDLRYARKEGMHIVARTRHGNLTVSTWAEKGRVQYSISNMEGRLYSGAKAGAVDFLVNAYEVV